MSIVMTKPIKKRDFSNIHEMVRIANERVREKLRDFRKNQNKIKCHADQFLVK